MKSLLKKVISEINIGLEMLGDTDLETFLKDEMLKRALGMTVINIGELVKNVTAHKYQTLRMEDVYTTVKEDFVTLKKLLKTIM